MSSQVDEALHKISEAQPSIHIMLLDACRDVAFLDSSQRPTNKGLAHNVPLLKDTIIGYAAGDNQVADDDPREPNSTYTKYL
jgi:hypothetical protein